MKFPETHIKKGQYKLHSGEMSGVFYDVNAMLGNYEGFSKIIKFIEYPKSGNQFGTYVGIATGGAIIASQFRDFAMVKDGELKGHITGSWCLIDDVVTTERSIKEAINLIYTEPTEIFVVVDRRKEKTLDITSMYEV